MIRRDLEDVQRILGETRSESLRISRHVRRQHVQRAAAEQGGIQAGVAQIRRQCGRHAELPTGDLVERRCGRASRKDGCNCARIVHDVRVCNGHALRHAGGTARVEHVGNRVRRYRHLWRALRLRIDRGQFLAENDRRASGWQAIEMLVGCQDERCPALAHLHLQTRRWCVDRQRHVRTARFQHGDERHDGLGRAVHEHTHGVPRLGTTRDEMMRELICARLELPARKSRAAHQRDAVGCARRLVLEQRDNGRRLTFVGGGVVPPMQCGAFLRRQQRKLPNTHADVANRSLEHRADVAQKARRIRVSEQIRAMPQRKTQAVRLLRKQQREVELRLPIIHENGLHVRVAEHELIGDRVLHREHAAEERRMARCLVRVAQIQHELLEGDVLVLVRLDGVLRDALQQLAECRISREARAHRQRVREVADQILRLRLVTSGNRGARDDVVLSAVTVEHRLICDEEHHVQRGSAIHAECAQLAHQRRGQHHRRTRALERLRGRSRKHRRQVEHRKGRREMLAPEPEMCLMIRVAHRVALPGREVGVLHVERRKCRRVSLLTRGVGRTQLAIQDPL